MREIIEVEIKRNGMIASYWLNQNMPDDDVFRLVNDIRSLEFPSDESKETIKIRKAFA